MGGFIYTEVRTGTIKVMIHILLNDHLDCKHQLLMNYGTTQHAYTVSEQMQQSILFPSCIPTRKDQGISIH